MVQFKYFPNTVTFLYLNVMHSLKGEPRVGEQIKSSGVCSFSQLNYTLPPVTLAWGQRVKCQTVRKFPSYCRSLRQFHSDFLPSGTLFWVLHVCVSVPLFQCFLVSLLEPEPLKPAGVEEKLRRPFFSASLGLPSPRSNPTRRRPIKNDSWVGHILCLCQGLVLFNTTV